VALQATDCNR